jgi:hypothetical protein
VSHGLIQSQLSPSRSLNGWGLHCKSGADQRLLVADKCSAICRGRQITVWVIWATSRSSATTTAYPGNSIDRGVGKAGQSLALQIDIKNDNNDSGD